MSMFREIFKVIKVKIKYCLLLQTEMPRYARKRNTRTRRRKRTGRKSTGTKMKIYRNPSVFKHLPNQLVANLTSTHLLSMNPGASAATAYAPVNLSNPINPFGTLSTGVSLVSTEHHPKYWNLWETVYDKFEVLGIKVSAQFLGGTNTDSHACFIVPAPTRSADEILTVIQDTVTFAPRIKEMSKTAIVKTVATATNESDHIKLYKKIGIRRIEGIKDKHDPTMVGTTSASGSETAPSVAPVAYVGLGALVSTSDLGTTEVIIKLDYLIRFHQVTADIEGTAV